MLARDRAEAGDCVFISAGTVHALGAGLVVAEIQQSSDTTFRLFDWNRLDADGKLRPLHTEQSLAVTDYRRGPVAPQQPLATDHPDRSRLVACDKFVLDRWQAAKPTNKPWVWSLSDGCALTTVVRGTAELEFMNAAGQTERASFRLGETALLPAALQEVRWLPSQDCVILSATLP